MLDTSQYTLEKSADAMQKAASTEKKPHPCPLCVGTGKILHHVPQRYVPCHGCDGRGVVWG